MVAASPLARTTRPITPGSAPYSLRHRASPIATFSAALGCTSAAPKPAPSSGLTPSTANRSWPANTPSWRRVRSPSTRFTVPSLQVEACAASPIRRMISVASDCGTLSMSSPSAMPAMYNCSGCGNGSGRSTMPSSRVTT